MRDRQNNDWASASSSERSLRSCAMLVVLILVFLITSSFAQDSTATQSGSLCIKDGYLLTVTHGRIQHGAILIEGGRITGAGKDVACPPGIEVLDADGRYVTPGIIDAHSHMGTGDDTNEESVPIVPEARITDAFDETDRALYRALAGGTTTELVLPGSAEIIGGQGVVIKNKIGESRDVFFFPGAPGSVKFAAGENPKRVFGQRGQLPSTRMGIFAIQRQAFADAQRYLAEWSEYDANVKKGTSEAKRPKRDLKLEALGKVLNGELLVQIHCYRTDDCLDELAIAHEFGYKVRALHHALEAYKFPDQLARDGVAVATWPDHWGQKSEMFDGIPWAPAMLIRSGVRVAIKSDSDDITRRLNQEAGKLIRYGNLSEEEALKTITLNPAWVLGVDSRVGSIDVGKDADLVIWHGYPLSVFSCPDKVLIDGKIYFDRSLPAYGLVRARQGGN